ncbi:MAG: D-alanine--D-alanine ligase [Patescibacteria group bacterium]|nr:D-alanine--D-alanine ligase [Patescibacteria group bacterium]
MRTVVAVLRGGPSSEYEVSLRSGASVLQELDKEKYAPEDIFISRSGEWHRHGLPVTPGRALQGTDIVFNALHGHYGEDGTVQRLLDTLGVPYTGSGAFASALAFNKERTKEAVAPFNVKVARHITVKKLDPDATGAKALELFRSFPMPAIVKPVVGGSSVGTTVVRDFPSLSEALTLGFAHAPKVLFEEFIRGREATVGVIDHFRGEKTYPLLPVEIIPPPESTFFDYGAKYSGASAEICPGNFSSEEKQLLMNTARAVHEGLGLSHYSRSDFIVSKRGVYFLETNTLPGLTSQSLLPKALRAVGSKFSDFLDHVITLARRKV